MQTLGGLRGGLGNDAECVTPDGEPAVILSPAKARVHRVEPSEMLPESLTIRRETRPRDTARHRQGAGAGVPTPL